MNPVERFTNDWWDMVVRVDRDREKQLNREHKEVYAEMIYQEHQEGKKSTRQIAEEYNIHQSTVCRIIKLKERP